MKLCIQHKIIIAVLVFYVIPVGVYQFYQNRGFYLSHLTISPETRAKGRKMAYLHPSPDFNDPNFLRDFREVWGFEYIGEYEPEPVQY